jgi:hypothetical protein
MSRGTPTKQASRSLLESAVGNRIMVAGPPNLGISLPPSGWFLLPPFFGWFLLSGTVTDP